MTSTTTQRIASIICAALLLVGTAAEASTASSGAKSSTATQRQHRAGHSHGTSQKTAKRSHGHKRGSAQKCKHGQKRKHGQTCDNGQKRKHARKPGSTVPRMPALQPFAPPVRPAPSTPTAPPAPTAPVAPTPTSTPADPNPPAGADAEESNAIPDGPSTDLGAGGFDNARIADIGLSKLGQNLYTPGSVDHGQCKQAVNDWVAAASNGAVRLGGSYYNDYVRVGAAQVGRDGAAKGDIIQLSIPGSPNVYKTGMHTAIVLSHAGGSNSFEVVDSNYNNDRIVRRHAWDPYATAARYGLQVNIWRTGDLASAPPPPPPPPPPPAQPAVFVHHVSGTCRDGACGLKVRTGPGYSSYAQVGTIPEGGQADVVCQARGERVGNSYASSGVWDRLTSGNWVADFYIDTPNIDQWSPPIPQC